MLYLLAACNYKRGITRWLVTIEKLGDKVKPVICMYETSFPAPNAIVHHTNVDFPSNPVAERFHDKKFDPIMPFVEENKNEFFFLTDTLDVVYQRPLPNIPSDVIACVSTEEARFEENPYWHHALVGPFEDLGKETIFNPGLLIMRGRELLEYWELVKTLSGSVNETVDLLALVKYLIEGNNKFVVWQDEFCNLYDQIKSCDVRGRTFYSTRTKRPFAAVHGNGSTKSILDAVYPCR